MSVSTIVDAPAAPWEVSERRITFVQEGTMLMETFAFTRGEIARLRGLCDTLLREWTPPPLPDVATPSEISARQAALAAVHAEANALHSAQRGKADG